MKHFFSLFYVAAVLAFAVPAASAETAPPPLNASDTTLVISWIARQVSDSRQEYCYRQTYGRGVGAPVSTCREDEDKNGALCYPKCREGFHGVGPVCWEGCPDGYTDTGALCTRPAATEHLTVKLSNCSEGFENTLLSCFNPHNWKTRPISHSDCDPGLHKEKLEAYCYSDCRPGFANTGVSCYRGPDTIAKKTYGRTAGTPMHCKPGTDNDAALCYPYCREGFHGVGPVCWERCPSGRTDCGAGCATSTKACAMDTASMVVAPVMLAWNIATFGSTSELTGIYKTISDTLKTMGEAATVGNAAYQLGRTVDMWVTDYNANFEKLTTPTVTKELGARFRGANLIWIQRQYALNHLHLMLTKDLDETKLNGLSAMGGFDPTGIKSVISAFAQPVCSSVDPFPNVTVR